MPRKKANTGNVAVVPSGRRTRRQTLQLQAEEQTPSPEATEAPPVAESAAVAATLPPDDPEPIIATPPAPVEVPQESEDHLVEIIPMDVEMEDSSDMPHSVSPDATSPVEHQQQLQQQPPTVEEIASEPPPQCESVPPSDTAAIESAIEKISIVRDEHEPPQPSPPPESGPTTHQEEVIITDTPSPPPPPTNPADNVDICSAPVSGSVAAATGEDTKEVEMPEDDSLSIRRSSRIKTISKTKQKSRGHGLVKKDVVEPVIDATPVTPQPIVTPSTPAAPVATEEQRPQKIKSRWLDSAKRDSLDLNNSLGITSESQAEHAMASTLGAPLPADPPPPPSDELTANSTTTTPVDYFKPDPEVIECLKQLQQIKDNIYTCERNVSKEAKKMTCDCFLTEAEKVAGELGCGEDCLNRMLMIECGSRCAVGDRCTNRRFQTHQYAPVVVFKTEMKGFGLRAAAHIEEGEFIMEYVGEVLNAKQFDKRANAYSKIKNKHYYFMSLRSDAVIDATGKGNISRFINHSCDPNAETQKWTVNGELRIGFFTTRAIAPGEEVTFDYQYQRYGKEAQKCFCEAKNCRGWIGESPDSEDEDGEEEGDEEEVEEEEEEADDEESGGEGEGDEAEKPTKKAGKKKGQKVSKKKTKAAAKKTQPKVTRKKEVTTTPAVKEPRKPRKTIRSRRQEMLDDLDLDAEIDTLARTGLKNQAHTLKLSRMMVRAKLAKTRLRLLGLVQEAEGPCKRLFLDYHGLRLLHGWMTDANDKKDTELKIELVKTLQMLPIPNKTMLKDSHVLSSVASYGGLKLDSEKKEIVSEEGPLVPKFQKKREKKEKKAAKEKAKAAAAAKASGDVKKEPETEEGVVKMEVDEEAVPEVKKEETVEEVKEEPPLTEEEEKELKRVALENEMRVLCKEMVLKWVQLPEIFRIPKRERIEQMKEHEREADKIESTLQVEDQDKLNER